MNSGPNNTNNTNEIMEKIFESFERNDFDIVNYVRNIRSSSQLHAVNEKPGRFEGYSIFHAILFATAQGEDKVFFVIEHAFIEVLTAENFRRKIERGPDKGITGIWLALYAAKNGHPRLFDYIILRHFGQRLTLDDFRVEAEAGDFKYNGIYLALMMAENGYKAIFHFIMERFGSKLTLVDLFLHSEAPKLPSLCENDFKGTIAMVLQRSTKIFDVPESEYKERAVRAFPEGTYLRKLISSIYDFYKIKNRMQEKIREGNALTEEDQTELYDAAVLANGTYGEPFYMLGRFYRQVKYVEDAYAAYAKIPYTSVRLYDKAKAILKKLEESYKDISFSTVKVKYGNSYSSVNPVTKQEKTVLVPTLRSSPKEQSDIKDQAETFNTNEIIIKFFESLERNDFDMADFGADYIKNIRSKHQLHAVNEKPGEKFEGYSIFHGVIFAAAVRNRSKAFDFVRFSWKLTIEDFRKQIEKGRAEGITSIWLALYATRCNHFQLFDFIVKNFNQELRLKDFQTKGKAWPFEENGIYLALITAQNGNDKVFNFIVKNFSQELTLVDLSLHNGLIPSLCELNAAFEKTIFDLFKQNMKIFDVPENELKQAMNACSSAFSEETTPLRKLISSVYEEYKIEKEVQDLTQLVDLNLKITPTFTFSQSLERSQNDREISEASSISAPSSSTANAYRFGQP